MARVHIDPDQVRWLNADERAAWMSLSGLVMKIPFALDAQLQRDADLSFFEYMILAALSEQPDHSMQMSDIARHASVSLSRLSHAAKRLESKGFLERARIDGPGRRTKAMLTQVGYAKVVESAPGHVAAAREIVIDALTSQQLATLRDIGVSVLGRIDPSNGCSDNPFGNHDNE